MPGKVLVVVYEFPPSGGGGVQRVAKLCRFLPSHGWEPVVVAGTLVPGRSTDESLVDDVRGVRVVRAPARHASGVIAGLIAPLKDLARMFRGRETPDSSQAGGAPSTTLKRAPLSSRLARWVAVPDDAAFWRGGAVRAAVDLGRSEQVDVVLASGPPFSAMMVGVRVARTLGVPLVLDMRDGWQTNPVVKMPTAVHALISRRQERATLTAADAVECTTPAIADEARAFGAGMTRVIPNGYDPDDLPGHAPDPGAPLSIVYMGKVYFGHSDPTPVFHALASLASESGPAAHARLTILGSWPPTIEATARDLGIADRVTFRPYLPHREALALVASHDVGLVVIADRPGAEGSCPAKLYEYVGMGLPVLLVGPSYGFPPQVLAETGGGVRVDPDDIAGIASAIRTMAGSKAAGDPLATTDRSAVERYSRPGQAAEVARLLETVVAGKDARRD